MPRLSRALIAFAAILSTTRAWAAPEAMQVLTLQSNDALEPARELTSALKEAVRSRAAVALVPGDYSLEVLSIALGCPETPDEPCLKKIAHKLRSRAFLWGTLQKADGELDLKLNLYRADGSSRSSEVRYRPQPAEGEAANVAGRALDQLLAPRARVTATSTPRGALPLAADTRDNDGAAAPIPASSLNQPLVTNDGATQPPPSSPPLNRSDATIGWSAVIAGGVLGAAGLYSTLRVNSINHNSDYNDYRAGISKTDDACNEANKNQGVPGAISPGKISDFCSQSKTYQALQYIFFGLGAVASGAGALILLTGDHPADTRTANAGAGSRWRFADNIHPSLMLSPRAAGVDLRLNF